MDGDRRCTLLPESCKVMMIAGAATLHRGLSLCWTRSEANATLRTSLGRAAAESASIEMVAKAKEISYLTSDFNSELASIHQSINY